MKKIIILFFAVAVMTACSGCQKIKKVFIKPPPEGVVEETLPIIVDSYQLSVVVKATPRELTDYISDLSRIQETSRAMGLFQLKIEDSSLEKKAIKLGQSFYVNMKILGLTIPCHIIIFKYKPEKDLWLLALTERGKWAWVIVRIAIKPVQEGSRVSINAMGRAPEGLGDIDIIDTFQLAQAVAGRIDLWMAIIQSEFDPKLDIKKLTEKGLRGELYKEFVQAHVASIWVDASPRNAAKWIINNLDYYMPELKIKGDCSSYRVFSELSEGQVRNCPGAIEFGKIKLDLNTFLVWREDSKKRIYRVYIQGLDRMAFFKLEVSPEAGGSRVGCMVVSDIPGPSSVRILDIMMALNAIPNRVRGLLLDIKQGVEGIG